MQEFYVWIVLLTPASVSRVMTLLLENSFEVGRNAKNKKLTQTKEGMLGCILNINIRVDVSKLDNDGTNDAAKVNSFLTSLMKKHDVPHYATLVAEPCVSSWDVGNIQVTETKALEMGPYRTPGT